MVLCLAVACHLCDRHVVSRYRHRRLYLETWCLDLETSGVSKCRHQVSMCRHLHRRSGGAGPSARPCRAAGPRPAWPTPTNLRWNRLAAGTRSPASRSAERPLATQRPQPGRRASAIQGVLPGVSASAAGRAAPPSSDSLSCPRRSGTGRMKTRSVAGQQVLGDLLTGPQHFQDANTFSPSLAPRDRLRHHS